MKKSYDDLLALVSGAWLLVNQTSYIYPNGTTSTPNPSSAQGANGTGIIIYHPNYYMSALLAPTAPQYRPRNLEYDKFDNTTDAEWAVLGKHLLAYSAPFTMEVLNSSAEDDGILTHGPLRITNIPSLEGNLFIRNFTILNEGAGLRLRMNGTDGKKMTLIWKRLG